MWDLFKAELLRLRLWTAAYALAHLGVLVFLARLVDLAQQPLLVYRVFGCVYALSGLLLGLYQIATYRRPATWLQLLHRPLAPWRIALALHGAGAVLLLAAIGLPLLLTAAGQALLTARVVDVRHWLLPVAAWLIACGLYLAGSYAVLGLRRAALAALVLPLIWLTGQASGAAAIAMQVLVVAWLAALVLIVFKPDLEAPPRRPLAVAALALPLQLGVYVAFLVLCFALEMLWIVQGSHPLNAVTAPAGGAIETDRMDGRQRLLAGLAASDDPQAALWREQVALADVLSVGGQIDRVLPRQALTNRAPMELDDAERRVRWVFSHDRMRLEGYRLTDGSRVGELGVGGDAAPFAAPALPAGTLPGLPRGDALLIAGDTLYQYGSETGRVSPRLRLDAGEPLAGVQPLGDAVAALGTQHLYVYDGRDAADATIVLTPRLRIALPGAYGDLAAIDLVERVDGYLVSFAFTAQQSRPHGALPYQVVLAVDDGGRVRTVARRTIAPDFPALYRYRSWWFSPALYALRTAAAERPAVPDPFQATEAAPIPRSIVALAVALSVLSVFAGAVLLRDRALSPAARIGWLLACAVIGVPALVALWLLYRPHERPDAAAAPHVAPA
jgi:hypothetical protein